MIPPFVRKQLTRLEQARHDLLDRREPIVAFISGRSGEGKTSLIAWFLGFDRNSRRYLDESLKIARQLNDVVLEAQALYFRAAALSPRGYFAEALECGTHSRSNDQLSPAHIAKGRAMDDAPKGSLMIHVGLCTHADEQYDGYSVVVTTVPQNRGSADALFTKSPLAGTPPSRKYLGTFHSCRATRLSRR